MIKVKVINLPVRTDRLEEIKKELFIQKITDYEVINPVIEVDPVKSLRNTAAQLLMEVYEERNEFALILEDDCEFINTSNIIKTLEEAVKELDEVNPFWEMLYLGANTTIPLVRINPPSSETLPLFRLEKGYGTHAILYNVKNLTSVLETLVFPEIFCKSEVVKKLGVNVPLDILYVEEVQGWGNCYITGELFAIQRPSFSDIEGRRVNYANLIQDRFKLNVKK